MAASSSAIRPGAGPAAASRSMASRARTVHRGNAAPARCGSTGGFQLHAAVAETDAEAVVGDGVARSSAPATARSTATACWCLRPALAARRPARQGGGALFIAPADARAALHTARPWRVVERLDARSEAPPKRRPPLCDQVLAQVRGAARPAPARSPGLVVAIRWCAPARSGRRVEHWAPRAARRSRPSRSAPAHWSAPPAVVWALQARRRGRGRRRPWREMLFERQHGHEREPRRIDARVRAPPFPAPPASLVFQRSSHRVASGTACRDAAPAVEHRGRDLVRLVEGRQQW